MCVLLTLCVALWHRREVEPGTCDCWPARRLGVLLCLSSVHLVDALVGAQLGGGMLVPRQSPLRHLVRGV